MIIGFGISPSRVKKTGGAVAFDADAEAFFTAASITDTTQKSAVNQLVLDLKSYNIWTKMKALYPIVGGSASSHAVNLKTPGTYNLTFSTGWTHASTGMTPSSAYANTNLIPNSNLTSNNTHISFYSRTNSDGLYFDMGIGNTSSGYFDIAIRYLNNLYANQYNSTTGRITASNTNSQGFYITSRTANNVYKVFKTGSQLGSTNTNTSSDFSTLTQSMFIGALQESSVAAYNSNRQCAFASIGDGLTDAEASNFYTAVQAYQTTLSRNV